uniref:hypothetical protein n=1 Tax=Arsukibacterium sp. TaxID=1977258 RepID=UPI002FDA9827
WSSNYLQVPVVFFGILGVIGIFEDIQTPYGQWEEYKIYIKYYAAVLGALGHALALFYGKKING